MLQPPQTTTSLHADTACLQAFNGTADISVLSSTATTCFLLHAAGIAFTRIDISAEGMGKDGASVHDCACGPAAWCKLRDCADMVLDMQQCASGPCRLLLVCKLCMRTSWCRHGARHAAVRAPSLCLPRSRCMLRGCGGLGLTMQQTTPGAKALLPKLFKEFLKHTTACVTVLQAVRHAAVLSRTQHLTAWYPVDASCRT